jgi:hypothetical protein
MRPARHGIGVDRFGVRETSFGTFRDANTTPPSSLAAGSGWTVALAEDGAVRPSGSLDTLWG